MPVEKVRKETLRSRGHDGNGEDGEELKGRRWGMNAADQSNEEQGTGVGEKGEEAKRKYENGDCKKREK